MKMMIRTFALCAGALSLTMGVARGQADPGSALALDGYVFFESDHASDILAWGVPTLPGGAAPIIAVERDGLRFVRTVAELGDADHGVAMRWADEVDAGAVRGEEEFQFPSYHVVEASGPLAEHWVTGYQRLVVDDVWEGVDLVLRSEAGMPRYDLELEPGVDPAVIGFEVNAPFEIREDGGLVVRSEWGELQQTAPMSYLPDSDAQEVESGFMTRAGGRLGFRAALQGSSERLVIDPGVFWSSYIGGNAGDWVSGMTFMDDLRFVFSGYVESKNGFPVIPGTFPWSDGGDDFDGFVVGVDTRSGAPLFSILIGGDGSDVVQWVGCDEGSGDLLVVAGSTSSSFPVEPAVDPWVQSASVLMRLDMSVPSVVYSKYIPGPGSTAHPKAFSLGPDGDLFVAGSAATPDAPYFATPGSWSTVPLTEGPIKPGSATIITPYASRIDVQTGLVEWRTFIDGSFEHLDVSKEGNLVIAGRALAMDHATTPGAYQAVPVGPTAEQISFIHVLSSDGTQLLAASYFGVPQGLSLAELAVAGVGVRRDGAVYLGGAVGQGPFPTTSGAYSEGFVSQRDSYIIRMSSDLSHLEAATLFGDPTAGDEFADVMRTFDVDESGVVTLQGSTFGTGFPQTPGAKEPSEFDSMYLSRLSPDLDRLLYSSLFGFKLTSLAVISCIGPSGQAMVGGHTNNPFLETTPTSAFPTYPEDIEGAAFVTGLDMLPIGVWRYGASTSPCGDPIALGVDRAPVAGDASFSMYAMQAVPNAVSVLIVSGHGDPIGAPVSGMTSFIDLTKPLHWSVVPSPDASGFQIFPLPIPTQFGGKELFAQLAYLDLGACGLAGVWGSSNALRLQVQ